MEREKVLAEKEPYDPPKATFVPLVLEERLMGCGLYSGTCYEGNITYPG